MMNDNLTHADLYKMLREEIMQNIREIGRLEVVCAVAVGSIYTWIFTQNVTPAYNLLWFIVPWIMIFCGIKILYLTFGIRRIATYLKRIEEASFGQDMNLPGWENYINQNSSRFDMVVTLLAAIFWVLSIFASIIIAIRHW